MIHPHDDDDDGDDGELGRGATGKWLEAAERKGWVWCPWALKFCVVCFQNELKVPPKRKWRKRAAKMYP